MKHRYSLEAELMGVGAKKWQYQIDLCISKEDETSQIRTHTWDVRDEEYIFIDPMIEEFIHSADIPIEHIDKVIVDNESIAEVKREINEIEKEYRLKKRKKEALRLLEEKEAEIAELNKSLFDLRVKIAENKYIESRCERELADEKESARFEIENFKKRESGLAESLKKHKEDKRVLFWSTVIPAMVLVPLTIYGNKVALVVCSVIYAMYAVIIMMNYYDE